MNKDKILKIILPTTLILILLTTWQILSEKEIINSMLFSNPIDIAKEITTNENLINHIANSVYRLLISVAIGYPLGILTGISISKIKKVKFVEDITAFFMSIPGISWAPIFIMVIGFGNPTIITVGVLTAYFPALYNSLHGIKGMNKNIIKVADMLEYKNIQKLFKIIIPAISNYLLIALKESFSRTWRTIIAVEMIAATMYGLGYMTYDARELLNMPVMFMGIIISGIIYLIIEQIIIGTIEKTTVVKWGMKKSS